MFSALRNTVLAVTAGLCLTAAANAEPTAFTDTLGTTIPTGSFSYDGAPQTVSDFVVAFAANSWIALFGCAGTPPNAGSFAVMSGTTTCAINRIWDFLSDSIAPQERQAEMFLDE